MPKATLQILTNEKGATKTKKIKYSTTDEETVEVRYSVNKGVKQLLGSITYSPSEEPTEPPKPNQAPVVEAGENQTVKQGVTVTLDGSAEDDGTITSAQWVLPDGIDPTEENEKELLVKFIAPTLPENVDSLLLNCTLIVEDELGLSSSKQCIVTVVRDVTVPPVEPPTPPSNDVLYNSNTTGKWQGNNRVVTDFDPLFPKPFVNGKGFSLNASGTNASATIADGVMTLKANKGHKRIYIDSSNYSTVTVCRLRFNDAKPRNNTIQKQSRHNHGGENTNKFGGLNHLTDLEEQKCGLSIELVHGASKINGASKSLPFKISVGEWVWLRLTDQVNETKKSVLSKTEYSKDGNSWVLGVEHEYDLSASKFAHIFNRALYLESSATWYRMNPETDGTEGISVADIEDKQLPIL